MAAVRVSRPKGGPRTRGRCRSAERLAQVLVGQEGAVVLQENMPLAIAVGVGVASVVTGAGALMERYWSPASGAAKRSWRVWVARLSSQVWAGSSS
ncbi:hypothetical protein Slala05_78980 [Streptomyces lavendulae subsp. lavendulae]|nr:hypothetical protein Slala05_78980 [Streptomyces lavendulae subsp. lavendulae]